MLAQARATPPAAYSRALARDASQMRCDAPRRCDAVAFRDQKPSGTYHGPLGIAYSELRISAHQNSPLVALEHVFSQPKELVTQYGAVIPLSLFNRFVLCTARDRSEAEREIFWSKLHPSRRP